VHHAVLEAEPAVHGFAEVTRLQPRQVGALLEAHPRGVRRDRATVAAAPVLWRCRHAEDGDLASEPSADDPKGSKSVARVSGVPTPAPWICHRNDRHRGATCGTGADRRLDVAACEGRGAGARPALRAAHTEEEVGQPENREEREDARSEKHRAGRGSTCAEGEGPD
jgi:hypothetical protein